MFSRRQVCPSSSCRNASTARASWRRSSLSGTTFAMLNQAGELAEGRGASRNPRRRMRMPIRTASVCSSLRACRAARSWLSVNGTAAAGIIASWPGERGYWFSGDKQLSDEAIVMAKPDVILMMICGGSDAAEKPDPFVHPALAHPHRPAGRSSSSAWTAPTFASAHARLAPSAIVICSPWQRHAELTGQEHACGRPERQPDFGPARRNARSRGLRAESGAELGEGSVRRRRARDRSARARSAIFILRPSSAAILFAWLPGRLTPRPWPSWPIGSLPALPMRFGSATVSSSVRYDCRASFSACWSGRPLAVSGAVMQGLSAILLPIPALYGVSVTRPPRRWSSCSADPRLRHLSIPGALSTCQSPRFGKADRPADPLLMFRPSAGQTSVATMLLAGLALAAMAIAFTRR